MRQAGTEVIVTEHEIRQRDHVELERSMRDRVVTVAASLVKIEGWHHMVDLVMCHHPRTQVIKAADDGQADDQDDEQLFDRKIGPEVKHRFVQPAIHAVLDLCNRLFSSHAFSVLKILA